MILYLIQVLRYCIWYKCHDIVLNTNVMILYSMQMSWYCIWYKCHDSVLDTNVTILYLIQMSWYCTWYKCHDIELDTDINDSWPLVGPLQQKNHLCYYQDYILCLFRDVSANRLQYNLVKQKLNKKECFCWFYLLQFYIFQLLHLYFKF